MSKLKAQGNASGTGVFTLQTPPTNTDRTISLPDSTGTLVDTTGATFTGGVTGTDVTLSGGLYVGGTGSANYLDDYEEGTFTPRLTDASNNSASPTIAVGNYVKIGKAVYIQLDLRNIDTSGLTTSDAIQIRDLPFTANNIAHTPLSMRNGNALNYSSYTRLQPTLLGGSNYIKLVMASSGTSSPPDMLVSGLASNSDMWIAGTYITT